MYTNPNNDLRFRTLMRRSVVDSQGQFDGVVIGTAFPAQGNVFGLDAGFGGGGFQQYFFRATPGFRHTTGNRMVAQTRGSSVRLVIAGYSANAQDLDPSMGVYAMDLLSGAADPGPGRRRPRQPPRPHGAQCRR